MVQARSHRIRSPAGHHPTPTSSGATYAPAPECSMPAAARGDSVSPSPSWERRSRHWTLSAHQLQLARERLGEAGVLERVDGFVSADIADLSMFADGRFDVVVCYGGALSYVCDQRHGAASELVRVVRREGVILTSVMSLNGAAVDLVRRPNMPVLKNPEGEQVWRVLEDGDLAGFPSPRVSMQHPPMHMYTSDDLRGLLPDCRVLELAGSNVTTFEGSTTFDEVLSDRQAWSTAVRLERELNSRPGLVDSGSHIIMAAQRL